MVIEGKALRRRRGGCRVGFIPAAAVVLFAWALALPARAAPPIEHWRLANGARVYLVSAHELPMVQLRVVFDAGSSRDPAGKHGLGNLVAQMLRQGAAGLGADAIAEGFERLGAEFAATADRDMVAVELRSLSDPARLDPAGELFAKLLARPDFPEEALERERARLRVALQQDRQNPGRVAQKHFFAELYGTHPYAHDPLGDEAGLKAIARADLVAHHRRYYVGRNAWLVIVGDVTRRAAQQLAERLVGGLPAGEPAPPLPPVAPLAAARTVRVPFDSTQAHLLVGQPGLRRDDPDYFPLYVGNYTLGGGGLVSRVSVEIREKRGLAYSAYSYFLPLREPGPFVMGLQTKNESAAEALRTLRGVLADFVARGPSDEELAAAKKHLTGAFPLRLDSNRKIADQVAVIAFYGLPLDYLDAFPRRVEAVTAAEIHSAFQRRIDPGRMLTVVLGGR
jgi:zinc protease